MDKGYILDTIYWLLVEDALTDESTCLRMVGFALSLAPAGNNVWEDALEISLTDCHGNNQHD